MALQKQHIFCGVTVPDAYHKVTYISGNKNKINVDVAISKDAAHDALGQVLARFSFQMEASDMVHDDGAADKNYTKQAYTFMKAAVFADLNEVEHDYTAATNV